VKRLFKEMRDGTVVGIDNLNDYYDPSLKEYQLQELEKAKPAGIMYISIKGSIADRELMAHCYSKLYNIPSTGLRFFTVYGPAGRPDMAYFSFTNKINCLKAKPSRYTTTAIAAATSPMWTTSWKASCA